MKFIRIIKSGLLNENSLGEPITNNEQTLQNFWNWFDGSKIIDKQGRPLVTHHYTDKSFDIFDKNKIGTSQDDGYFGMGFYFTGSSTFGKEFGKNKMNLYLNLKNPMNFDKFSTTNDNAYNTYDFLKYLDENKKIESYSIYYGQEDYYNHEWDIEPDDITFNKIHQGKLQDFSEAISNYAKINGFDGIISDDNFTEIIAFEPNQIKSISNNTNYSQKDNSIYGSKQ